MHYLIYQITNTINGKIYIGKHKTDDLSDQYMGSGVLLHRAIKKYGIDNFKKEILCECSSEEEMNLKERELVNEEFVNREDTYNLKVGGDGGWDYCNRPENHNNIGNHRKIGCCYIRCEDGKNLGRHTIDTYTKEEYEEYCKRISEGLKEKWSHEKFPWIGKHHSDETRKKISEKNKISQLGERNSQFGTKCIFNEELKKTIHVKESCVQFYLNNGWKLGAVYNWDGYFRRKNQVKVKRIRIKKVNNKPRKSIEELKSQYTEMYKVYCEFGFNAVKERFGYKFSQVNFVNQCKRYVDSYIPQNGKKRGRFSK